MSDDSADKRAVGAHPESFSGRAHPRWTSWTQADPDPMCFRSCIVDTQHRRAVAHAAAKLCGRTRLTNDLLFEIQEILLQAGWALFWAGSSYAVIKVSAVEGWARIASKWIRDDLEKVKRGSYDFDELEKLLLTQDASSKNGEEKEEKDD